MRPLLAALLLLALAGCSTFADVAAPPPPDPKTLMTALETRIAVLIADERQRLDPKARPLMIDPELTQIARQRAADMAAKNYMAHAAPNGDTAATLLMAQDSHFQGILGEDIAAQHYSAATGIDVDAFARRFVDTWLDNQSHKNNLAFADYDHTGIGAAVNGDTVYVMQLFSSDLGMGPHKDDPTPSVATPLPNAKAGLVPTPTPKPEDGLRGSEGTR